MKDLLVTNLCSLVAEHYLPFLPAITRVARFGLFSHVLAVFQPTATNKVHSVDPVMNNIIQSIVIVDIFRPKFGCMIRNIAWHICI